MGPAELNGLLTSPLRSIHRANLFKKHDVILIAHTILKK